MARPARHRPAPHRRRLPARRRGGGPAARVLRARRPPHPARRRARLGAAPLRARLRARRARVEALTDWLLAGRALLADADAPGYERRRRAARRDLRRRPTSATRWSSARRARRSRSSAPRWPASCAPSRRSRRSSTSSAAACARCCATCSAATSTRRCAALADEPARASSPSALADAQPRTGARARARARRRRARRPRARGRRSSAGRRARARRCSTFAASRAASAASSRADGADALGQRRRRAPRRAPAAARRRRRAAACTRLTTSPPNGIPASRSLRWKKIASSTGSWRGAVTIRNVVAGSSSSAPTRRGALGEAVDHPAERAEEHRQVAQQVDAGDALQQPEHDAGAAARGCARRARRGAGTSGSRGPGRSRVSRPGRVEEVERVARRRRVEHEQVEVALLVELVELGDRGELLRAGDRARELLVDPVGEHLVARALVRREVLDQLVERALGVEHHRPQLAAHLDAVRGEALGVDQPRLVAELLEPERVGQPPRRVDRHHGDLQPALGHARARRAAAVVVLPTPPEPAQMTIRLPSSSGRSSGSRQHRRGRQIRPSRTANATACERLRALSFVTTSCRTFFTVRSE